MVGVSDQSIFLRRIHGPNGTRRLGCWSDESVDHDARLRACPSSRMKAPGVIGALAGGARDALLAVLDQAFRGEL